MVIAWCTVYSASMRMYQVQLLHDTYFCCGWLLRLSMVAAHTDNLLPEGIMATDIRMFGTAIYLCQLLLPVSSFIGLLATAE